MIKENIQRIFVLVQEDWEEVKDEGKGASLETNLIVQVQNH